MKNQQERPTTIKDVADLLGFAHSTVSRALNDHPGISADTKSRVRQAAADLGYVTNSGARSMRTGSNRLVGLIVPDIQNDFYSAAASAMAERCAQLGYELMLGVSDDDPAREERHMITLRERRVEAVLFTPSRAPTNRTADLLSQLPAVQFLRFDPRLGHLAVTADDIDGTRVATEHLIGLGHRTIAFLGGTLDTSTGRRRVAGYEMALERHGLTIDRSLLRFGARRPEFGEAALGALLSARSDITAVVIAGSRQLLGALGAVQKRGLAVPKDLSIVGYGDAEWFEVSNPSITAVRLPVREMSERATQLLFQTLDRKIPLTGAAESEFSTRFIHRASTAKNHRAG